MKNNDQEKNKFFSDSSKRDELYQRYSDILSSGGQGFPEDFSKEPTNKFIQSQMDEFNWPNDQRIELDDESHKDFMLSYYENMVESSITYYGRIGCNLEDIIAGPLNLGSFEATLRTMFGDGAVILVNAGLQSMMWQCGKVLVNGVVGETEKDGTFYDTSTVADYLVQIVDKAAQGDPHKEGDPRKARRTEFNSIHSMVLAAAITDSAAQFIIAHEVGHLTENPDDIATADELELRADALAMQVIINEYYEYKASVDGKISNNHRIRLICHLLAPILMMELWHLTRCREALRSGSNEINYGTYPSDLTRRDNLIAQLVHAGFWTQIEDKYRLFSKCINEAYHLMLYHFGESSSTDLDILSILENERGQSKNSPICNSTVFKNDKLLVLAEIKEQIESSFEEQGIQVQINPDVIEHTE